MADTPTPFNEGKFPSEFRAAEKEAIAERRHLNNIAPSTPLVGVALSGGGIRSATFCLGLFQALAHKKLIRRIDYLSTVSGGGYFGSFLGTAFTRDDANAETVEQELSSNHSWPVNWLRENGRFLSPNGSGDNWMTAAIALRNWVALHLVLLTFCFLFLGLASLLRGDLASWSVTREQWDRVEQFFWYHPATLSTDPESTTQLWLSPWTMLPIIPFALLMLPPGLFYWATQLSPVIVTLRTIAGWFSRSARSMTNAEFASRLQNGLTRMLMVGLISFVLLLVFALMDSLGQTAYLRWSESGFAFPTLWTGVTGAGMGLYAFAAKITLYVEQLLGSKKFRITFDVIALGLALIWLSLILFSVSVVSAGFLWEWRSVFVSYGSNELRPPPMAWTLMLAVGVCFGLSWFFSRSFGFVNLSSMQQMYAARLARAYLGATNPLRRAHANHSMTDLIPGDEVPLDEYNPHASGGPLHLINVTVNETVSGKTQIERRDRKGLAMAVGPCGVSVGLDSHALWAIRDPKAEKSLLKALWEERTRVIHPIATEKPAAHALSTAPFPGAKLPRHHEAPASRRVEALSLGRWVAISGAAFTTGTGANTHLGLSLLLGLANIRLGYWWNSGINPAKRPRTTKPNFMELGSRLLAYVMPVQTCLVGEFFARFHGPNRKHWYLSDGGHFENTACYELIRRRVPLIICSDAGQDAKYQFEDLANLVRKARTDYGAEIQIVRHREDINTDDPGVEYPMPVLEDIVHPELLDVIGTPDDFVPLVNEAGETPDQPVRSKRHAVLARVHYLDDHTFSWLLMVKPSLMGDESLDVIQYQRTHPTFPQEPTSDQYFDEAQWESYRKLGEHIGNELFTPPTTPGKGWFPASLTPLSQ